MTTNLLIFFAIPIAIVIFSIALEKILRNPFLVTGIIFSSLLIVTLAFFDPIYLIAVVAYTLLAFITTIIYRIVNKCLKNCCNSDNNDAETIMINNKSLIDNSEMYNTDNYSNYLYENNKCRNRKYY